RRSSVRAARPSKSKGSDRPSSPGTYAASPWIPSWANASSTTRTTIRIRPLADPSRRPVGVVYVQWLRLPREPTPRLPNAGNNPGKTERLPFSFSRFMSPTVPSRRAAARPPSDQLGSLRATGLQKTYGKRTVVHDVSLSVDSGEVVGLLGPNGAGKTTSFYMIVGIVPTDAGRIEI